MKNPFKVAIIGLDTSHSTALPKLMQDPETPVENRVPQLLATRALRFPSPFQSEAGQDERQSYLEKIGVKVTTDFDEAVADCDGVMLEINDPALHLPYFEKCAKLGKPIFLDKPFADNYENMLKIIDIARENKVRFFTASSLRFDADFVAGLAKKTDPQRVVVWGPVGQAKAGSSVIWYGCHTFEMLEAIMGQGAVTVNAAQDRRGYSFQVIYRDGRRGIVDMSNDIWRYGAVIRNQDAETFIQVTGKIPFYRMLLQELVKFFDGAEIVPLADAMEVMALLDAADRSVRSHQAEPVYVG